MNDATTMDPSVGAQATMSVDARPDVAAVRRPTAAAPHGRPTRRRTLRETLIEEPARFTFDAAVAVMMRAAGRPDPGSAIRFHAPPGLAFVGAEVSSVEPAADGRFRATVGMLGLTGPGGLLPRAYTEAVNGEQRRRSTALAAFLDVLAQRALSQFAAAGIKYRPHRSADLAAIPDAAAGNHLTRARPRDGLADALLALTGHATPGLADRLALGTDPLFFYAGAFAARPRSAERLAAILSDWLGQPVEVEQFAGRWLDIGADGVSALPRSGRPGQFNQLGVDAAIGTRAWDIQSRVVLRVGPLRLDAFLRLLPGGSTLRQLTALARAYLDGAAGFSVNPVLAADAVPALALDMRTPVHLGWNSWLPTAGPRRRDANEASFGSDDGVLGGVAPGLTS